MVSKSHSGVRRIARRRAAGRARSRPLVPLPSSMFTRPEDGPAASDEDSKKTSAAEMPVGMSGGRSSTVPCFSPCAYLSPPSDPSADKHLSDAMSPPFATRLVDSKADRPMRSLDSNWNTRAGFSLAHFGWGFDHLPVLALGLKPYALAPRRELNKGVRF